MFPQRIWVRALVELDAVLWPHPSRPPVISDYADERSCRSSTRTRCMRAGSCAGLSGCAGPDVLRTLCTIFLPCLGAPRLLTESDCRGDGHDPRRATARPVRILAGADPPARLAFPSRAAGDGAGTLRVARGLYRRSRAAASPWPRDQEIHAHASRNLPHPGAVLSQGRAQASELNKSQQCWQARTERLVWRQTAR